MLSTSSRWKNKTNYNQDVLGGKKGSHLLSNKQKWLWLITKWVILTVSSTWRRLMHFTDDVYTASLDKFWSQQWCHHTHGDERNTAADNKGKHVTYKEKNAAARIHRLKHQTSMPDPFAHSESDWSFRDGGTRVKEAVAWRWPWKTLFNFQQCLGALAFSSVADGLQSTGKD